MHTGLAAGKGSYAGADPEDPDEYRAENVFWVPKEARWSHLQANAKQPTIGKVVDDAMVAIEWDNSRLKGVSCPRSTPGPRSINIAWAN
jgi:type I restriction enzyme M protein